MELDRTSRFLKWVMIVPAFLISFVLTGVIFRYVIDLMIVNRLIQNNLQLGFILHHIYDDFFCIGMSILFSCTVAPRRRITISLVYFMLLLIMIPKRLELAQSNDYYGYYPWKTPLLVTLYVLSGLVPVVILWWSGRRAKPEAAATPKELTDLV